MNFTREELAVLNQMISVALLSGKVRFDEISKSIYDKVATEIIKTEEPETK